MDEAIVSARHIRKEFTVHTHQATTIKEMAVKNFFAPSTTRTLVALDDVSFDLEGGHSLAIIGANGSGKSTMLKLIAGISEPTSGTLSVRGRVAALLELGAGFETEFTGMENIFLQCSILGLSREEILARLDDILEFSQLDKFIHTPVKRYSSGMYIRLGFSIAAHVDARILLLDEVLAVGDTAFQVKCMRKIKDLREEGRSILFVSHTLEHIEAIADQVLWLQHGRVHAHDSAERILPQFYETLQSKTVEGHAEDVHMNRRAAAALPTGRFRSTKARMTAIRFLDDAGNERKAFRAGEPMILRADIEVIEPLDFLELSIAHGTMDSVRATWMGTGELMKDVAPGPRTVEARIENLFLVPGRYLVSFMLGDPHDLSTAYDMHLRVYALSIQDANGRIGHDVDEGRVTSFGKFV